jgi:hypothetical protein
MDLNSLDLKELKKLEAEVRNRIATYEDAKLLKLVPCLKQKQKNLAFHCRLLSMVARRVAKLRQALHPSMLTPKTPA